MLNSLSRARAARRTNGEAGFTLIELLIVIVILGVLASIVVFSVRGITDRGKTSACKADVSTVSTAVEAYYAQKGTYPTAIADTTPTDPSTLVGGGFLRSAPAAASAITYVPATGGVTSSAC